MTITDKNRDDIQHNYVNAIIDGLDTESMGELLYFYISQEKELLTNEVLESEVVEYYPSLLEE